MKVHIDHMDMNVRRPEEGFYRLASMHPNSDAVIEHYRKGTPIVSFKLDFTLYDLKDAEEIRDKCARHGDMQLMLDAPESVLQSQETLLIIKEIQDIAELVKADSKAVVRHDKPALQYLLSILTDIKNAIKNNNWCREQS